jgi:hypothetical protein
MNELAKKLQEVFGLRNFVADHTSDRVYSKLPFKSLKNLTLVTYFIIKL